MDRKLESNTYTDLKEFTDDARRIFVNCRAYNDPGSNCKFRSYPVLFNFFFIGRCFKVLRFFAVV